MRNFLLSFILLLSSITAAYADFNDGVVAYLMGDYEKAYATMRSLADTADHGYAQYYLGMMYLNGQGVEQSYEEAGNWFLRSAKHGIPQAQYKLGILYSKGQGLPRDYESAYAWYRVGAEHKHMKSINAIDAVKAKLSGEELEEAEKLSTELISKYGPVEGEGEADRIIKIDNE